MVWQFVAVALAGLGIFVFLGTIVVAFKNDQMFWGICGICVIVPIVNLLAIIPFLIYTYFLNPDKWTKSFSWGLFLAGLVNSAILFGVHEGAPLKAWTG